MQTTAPKTYGTCPVCNSRYILVRRSDGCEVFPTHGHTFGNGGRKAPKCRVSGFSVQGLVIIQGVIDLLVAIGNLGR